MKERRYIKIKPDEFSKLEFDMSMKIEDIFPLPECNCLICEEFGNHFG